MAEYTVTAGARVYAVTVEGEDGGVRVAVDGVAHAVGLEPTVGSTHFELREGRRRIPVVIRGAEGARLVGIADEQYRVRVEPRLPIARRRTGPRAAGPREVIAPMPGLVVAVEVTPGVEVAAGAALLIIEAMKMQSEIRAPVAGRVTAVRTRPGQEVPGGAVLAVIEPTR